MKHQLTIGDATRINPASPVKVYRNLTKKCYSVQQAGIVVAYLNELEVTEATFAVNQAGRRKCIREKQKNVHAFIIGKFASGQIGTTSHETGCMVPVGYNPYRFDSFRCFSSPLGDPVHTSPLVSIYGKSVHALVA